jgi:hypothetical protein
MGFVAEFGSSIVVKNLCWEHEVCTVSSRPAVIFAFVVCTVPLFAVELGGSAVPGYQQHGPTAPSYFVFWWTAEDMLISF